MNTFKSVVRKNIVFIAAFCRIIVLLSISFLTNPGLRYDQARELRFILLPLSYLYIVLLIIYVIRYAYKSQLRLREFTPLFVGFGYVFIIALHAFELLIITFKSLAHDYIPSDTTFFAYIVAAESALGIFTAFYLSGLFLTREPEQPKP